MSKPAVYLETTIPSYLTARVSRDLLVMQRQIETQDWWNAERHKYDLFVSLPVLEEISRGDKERAQARQQSLENVPVLASNPLIESLEDAILGSGLIPAKAEPDVAHIAYATVHQMDYLLTWNCRHINNATIKRSLEKIVESFGLRLPVICTPEELRDPYQ